MVAPPQQPAAAELASEAALATVTTVAPLLKLPALTASASVGLLGGHFKAGRRELEELCTQILGTTGDWQLHSDEVFVDWGSGVAQVGSTSSPLGWSFLCVRILVSGKKGVRSIATHVFVDHPLVMTFGRERYGLPVLLASFAVDDQGVTVTIVGDSNPLGQAVVRLKHLDETGGKQAPVDLASLGFSNGAVPFVQLKQMRAGLQPDRACYQELIEVEVSLSPPEPLGTRSLEVMFDHKLILDPADFGFPATAEPTLAKTEAGYQALSVTGGLQVLSQPKPPVRSGRDGPTLRLRRGDPQAAPSYEFKNVEIVGFRVPVRPALLQQICDTFLNRPFQRRGYEYRPANVDLVIECLDYGSMTSENPPIGFDKTTSTRQRELVFRLLVGRVDRDGFRIRTPAVFCPFLFVDSPWSLISGREVIGYPKLLAEFDPFGEAQFEACKVTTAHGSLSNKDQLPLITIDCRFERQPASAEALFAQQVRPAPPAPTQLGRQSRIDFAWWGLADLQSGGADGDTFIRPWLDGRSLGYPGLQLKRFADANDPNLECFSEIVEFDYTLLRAEVSLPQHNATLYFPEKDPHGLVEAFDFSSVVPVPPGSWYRTNADFRFRITDPLD